MEGQAVTAITSLGFLQVPPLLVCVDCEKNCAVFHTSVILDFSGSPNPATEPSL